MKRLNVARRLFTLAAAVATAGLSAVFAGGTVSFTYASKPQ